jgi:DNA invertase Pin-like site-specific DNA recombinase
MTRHIYNIRYGSGMDIGYATVSTAKQDLTRQLDALAAAGISKEHIFMDKKSGATTARPGLQDALTHARDGDILVVHTLDRLGRTVRDTLNMVHDLKERGVGVRTLADPLAIDTAESDAPMSHLAFVMLALFGQMERTYAAERAAHARSVATANGRRTGRPSVVDPAKLEHAALLRANGSSMREITTKTGLKRTTLYRHLPPRSAVTDSISSS